MFGFCVYKKWFLNLRKNSDNGKRKEVLIPQEAIIGRLERISRRFNDFKFNIWVGPRFRTQIHFYKKSKELRSPNSKKNQIYTSLHESCAGTSMTSGTMPLVRVSYATSSDFPRPRGTRHIYQVGQTLLHVGIGLSNLNPLVLLWHQ